MESKQHKQNKEERERQHQLELSFRDRGCFTLEEEQEWHWITYPYDITPEETVDMLTPTPCPARKSEDSAG